MKRHTQRPHKRLHLTPLEHRIAPAFASFRAGDGVTNYTEAQISAASPSTVVPVGQALIAAGENSTYGKAQSIIKFDNLFGTSLGRIPANATVKRASLTLFTVDGSPFASAQAHRLFKPWSPSAATWDHFVDGIQSDNVESSTSADFAKSVTAQGYQVASGDSLPQDLYTWQSGASYFGWVISAGYSGSHFSFASAAAEPARRPLLTIEYDTPGPKNASYVQVQGTPPSPTKLAWFSWADGLQNTRLARVPNARTQTFYFAQNGNDETGWGTPDRPWRSLAKAQSVLNSSAGDIRLRFRRGDTWRESTALGVYRSGVTIDDYGDATLTKPLFTRFKTINAATWTQVQGDLYSTVIPQGVGWVRETANSLNRVYYRAASSIETANRPFSWYYDASGMDPASGGKPKLYVNAGATPGAIPGGLEYCPSDGAGWVVNADNVRLQNLRMDGNGITPDGQGYGLVIAQRDQYWEFVGQGLEVYYTGYHAIGHILQYNGSRGVATLVDSRAGFVVNRHGTGGVASGDATVFVAYSDWGGNEFIMSNSWIEFGVLPSADWQATPGLRHGQGFYSHVGAGGALDLVILRNTGYALTDYPLGVLNQIDNAAFAPTLADVRAYIVEDQRGPINSWWNKANVAVINCVYDQTAPPQVFDGRQWAFGYGSFYVAGWLINCTVTIDARNQFNGFYLALWGSQVDSKYINCHFDIFNAPQDVYFQNPNSPGFNNLVLTNSIISFDTARRSGMYTLNAPANLRHNGYFMPNLVDDPLGHFDGDAGAIVLSKRFAAGMVPSPSNPLNNGGIDVGLEYDQRRQPRGKLRTIGPLTGTPLPAPIAVDYGWGLRTASLTQDMVIANANTTRFTLGFAADADVWPGSLKLWNDVANVAFSQFTYDPITHAGTWRLPNLPVGRYTLELDGRPIRAFRVLPGDFDSDNVVSLSDFLVLRGSMGTGSSVGDLDGDGYCDLKDLIAFRQLLGTAL